MQPEPSCLGLAVPVIANDGRMERSKMHSKLVGAAGARRCSNERKLIVDTEHFEVRVRWLAAAAHLFAPSFAMTQIALTIKRGANFPSRVRRQSHHCLVLLSNGAVLELFHQRSSGNPVACEQNHP